MKNTIEKKIVNSLIKVLRKNTGFDEWWDRIDTDTKNEILIEMARVVNSKIK
jgi:hypothetical protein